MARTTLAFVLAAAVDGIQLLSAGELQNGPLSLVQIKASADQRPHVDASSEKKSGCLEDMCVDGRWGSNHHAKDDVPESKDDDILDAGDLDVTAWNEPQLKRISQNAACAAHPSKKTRTLVTGVSQAYHGSTALEEILMSSDELTTLCSCKTWQCEASWLDKDIKQDDASKIRDMDYTKYLATLSKCWDLDQKILFQKYMLPDCRSAPEDQGGEEGCQFAALQAFHESLKPAKLTTNYHRAGITGLNHAYLLLWRPLCMYTLSSHALAEIKHDHKGEMARREVLAMQEMANMHKYLTDHNVPSVLVSLASLIWEPERNQRRFQAFLPCAGKLDINYVPEMDSDIFKQNFFKAEGSVKEFGMNVSPQKIGYNVGKRSCYDTKLLKGLDANLTKVAREAEDYLAQHS